MILLDKYSNLRSREKEIFQKIKMKKKPVIKL